MGRGIFDLEITFFVLTTHLFTIMPDTCCVGKCQSNYAKNIRETGKTYAVFSFPSENDPERSRKEWYESLPIVTTDTPGKKI